MLKRELIEEYKHYYKGTQVDTGFEERRRVSVGSQAATVTAN